MSFRFTLLETQAALVVVEVLLGGRDHVSLKLQQFLSYFLLELIQHNVVKMSHI